ncbi:hypothetical protein, partial [Rhizobium sp. RHZ01]|uniref:hypothetical protein n=1 Tax=Rhizobium sp. RHZ01 TaxID=2769304 RepID=UPI001AEF2719
NDDFRSAAPLAVVASHLPTIKCMPAVMDLDFFPDMGRMSGRLRFGAKKGFCRRVFLAYECRAFSDEGRRR